jgi:hypothetical protein
MPLANRAAINSFLAGTKLKFGPYPKKEAVMSVRESPPQPAPPHAEEPPPYPAEKARGGEIILRTRPQRWIFISGLVGAFLLAVLLSVAAYFSQA